MASEGVGNTALGAAVCRLIEQYQPAETRLFNDPVVKDLVGAPLRIAMQIAPMRSLTVNQTNAVAKGLYGAQVCRARFIDDTVQNALASGIGQLVILGAGLDTRPYRLKGVDKVKVFEVDLPSVQNNKKNQLQKHLGRLPSNVTFIPIDFDTQTLDTAFTGTAFDISKPAVFIWEGVTQYISEAAVRQTLSFVGKSAPGSVIVFTYVLKSVVERRSDIPGAGKMMDRVSRSAPWVFGLEPADIKDYLQPFHLSLVIDVGNKEYQEKYLQPLHRTLDVSEIERTVQAVVASG
jgi:methyltransferase (TIGR00027 family)